jgi:hypothetical protein
MPYDPSDMHSGWFGVRCEQCRKFAPCMEQNDLCQECNDYIANKDAPNA